MKQIKELFPESDGFKVSFIPKEENSHLIIVEAQKAKDENIEQWGERADRYFNLFQKAMGEEARWIAILFFIKNGRDVDFNLYSMIRASITYNNVGYEFDPTTFHHGDAAIWHPNAHDNFEFKPLQAHPIENGYFCHDGAVYRAEDNWNSFINYLSNWAKRLAKRKAKKAEAEA